MFELTDRVAIVTGGARGIGKGICLALAKQGANIAIADILVNEGNETIAEIEKLGRKGLMVETDITVKDQVDQMVKKVMDTFGKIDILVNNAGWDKMEPFMESKPETWEKVIAINYKGVIHFTHAVLEQMIPKSYGKIINISSDAGRVGSMGEAVYSGCKGAIIAFTKTIAREMARYKINVNCVCPGPTPTPLVEEMRAKGGFAEKVFAGMERIIPLRRMGEPEDIAHAVVFLASDEANFITGQTLSVSGGLTMC
ncbi:MAG TPA: 3-oxoacyl-ACP reductase FabG [Candidatus Latescibacteria bacterium]|nr:3-oxoacyl-ACP reductase FabG [Candidatus Latescibacterota bacterium]